MARKPSEAEIDALARELFVAAAAKEIALGPGVGARPYQSIARDARAAAAAYYQTDNTHRSTSK